MNCSTPGLPVHHQLPESTQTHVHWVGDAIQPSNPLSPSSPPALNLSQHQGLFQWVSSLHQVAKVLEFQLQHQSFQYLFIIYKLGNIHFGTGYMCSKFFSWWLCSVHAQIDSDSLWHHRLCLAGYSVHGIFQARILECVAILFSRESSWLRARTRISCIAGRFFTTELPGSPFLIVVYDKKYLRPVYNIMNFSWTWLISFLLISLIA